MTNTEGPSMTDKQRIATNPVAGERVKFRRGEVRIDEVTDDTVYFVRWRGNSEIGEPIRKTRAEWRLAVERESP